MSIVSSRDRHVFCFAMAEKPSWSAAQVQKAKEAIDLLSSIVVSEPKQGPSPGTASAPSLQASSSSVMDASSSQSTGEYTIVLYARLN